MRLITQKKVAFLTIVVLILQIVLVLESIVYSENDASEQSLDEVETTQLLNQTSAFNFEEQESNPRFFFSSSSMRGTLEYPMQVTFFSDQEVSEARVFLPEEAKLIKEQLPAGISVEQGEQSREWIVQSERAQTTFVLPLVFEKAGDYELSVEEATVHLEISEQEETIDGNSVESTYQFDVPIESQEYSKMEVGSTEGFEEESNSRSTMNVSNWAGFRSAINNNNVTTINVMGNISGNTSLNIINRDLIINGNGFVIDVQRQSFRIANGRILTVRDSTINSSITNFTPIFGPSTTNSSTTVTFIFTDIVIPTSINRVVGRGQFSTNTSETINVVFSGGTSRFTGNTANAVVGGPQIFP